MAMPAAIAILEVVTASALATLTVGLIVAAAACSSGSAADGSARAADASKARTAAAARVRLLRLGTFDQPTFLTAPPGDRSRRFVTERAGRIRVVLGRRKLR